MDSGIPGMVRIGREGHPIVLAHGVFDPLHYGHVRHLEAARKLGNSLIVSVTSDRFVRKGRGRPRFTAEQRAEVVAHLGFVDDVWINDAPDAVPAIQKFRPAIYVKGSDYAGREDEPALAREIAAVRALGGEYRMLDGTEMFSSSRLLAEDYGEEIIRHLDGSRDLLPRIEAAFERVRQLRALFVGERIIDEYIYVAPLAKPSKETVVAVHVVGSEEFAGGVAAAAAHAGTMCKVDVLEQPTDARIVKRRYVERGFNKKLFEAYSRDFLYLDEDQRQSFDAKLDAKLSETFDLIVVFDFGHGLISPAAVERLGRPGPRRFLAVNAQSNAANWGFNPVTKYRRPDYLCVDVQEARLAARDQRGQLCEVIAKLRHDAQTDNVVVTAGREGVFWPTGHVPAIAKRPVDTIGAGDCFLAFTAPLLAVGLDLEATCFVGNVAAGMKTEIVGHRNHIDAEDLLQTVRALLR